ncbi:polyhomeotic-like protein 2 isoform X2 [Dermochelys coriacea]|uniref:polyhomeotic-like protein 2 isoform X2 n=1 Tax=Dermochelys coriacea TaxID=27794 RepID=UPI0018E7FD1F|nr:polyhomeotic-like protein 2 isoform X2 [Dermochelys coriacea]XP_043356033.1 polyhomeotic-like protein 2 isoform X2 [Dermochelys coriacea]XP_043356034.1 polyhomeotic-like protein 2 isoform X2 [Dermochelys coriacea]
MENEQLQVPPPSSSTSTASSSNGRQPGPQISVYSGIPDRQTVQVIQQALQRQPSTAAQYLQQMYAAQQQHLMLQTAALQQQHLGSAQLQSLAAVQQASLAANRQSGSSSSNAPSQTPSQQPTINLATSPAAAQLINRAQSVNSAAASGIAQQAVLLGNATSPALTASQAQMYLRAQMLIFTPTATVTAVQPEGSAAPTSQPSTTTAQVQNLAIRAQQTVAQGVASSQAQQLPTLAMKPALSSSQPASNTSQGKAAGPAPSAAAKGSQAEQAAEHLKKGDGSVPTSMDNRGHPMSRTVTPVTTHPLIAPAYAQLQPHQLIQQQKQIQHQFVIQQQQLQPRSQPQLIQGGANTSPQLQPLPPPTPSLAVQPSLQVQGQSHTAPQGPAPLSHPPQCQASSQHKQSANQPYQPALHAPGLQAVGPAQPAPEGGPQNGHPGCLNHATQRKFQHASAVILQLQPAIGTPQLSIQENARKDGLPADKNPESLPAQLPPPPQAALMPPAAPPDPEVSEGNRPPTHEPGQDRVHVQNDPSSPGMTSGNGNSASTVAGTAPQNGENKPPQAIVKPQVLTHVIEGFVIQEGAEPFPVGRSSLLVGNLKKKYAQGLLAEKLPQQDNTTTTDSEMEEPYLQESKEEGNPPKLKCELCGRVDFAYKFKRSKRFCSMACAKRYNVGCTKRVGLFHPDRSKLQKPGATAHGRRRTCKGALPVLSKDTKKQTPVSLSTGSVPLSVTASLQLNRSQEDSSRCSDNSSYEEPLSPLSASSSTSRRRQGERDLELPDMHMRDLVGIGHHFLPSEPTKWNVEDVYEFIRSLPGCQEIAEEFRAQEIDGQALLLLKEDHLMSAMNIKLGPALKIYARISMLKDS